MKYLRTEDDLNFFSYVCEGCESEGELGIPNEPCFRLNCPEECGASYVSYTNIEGKPDLVCVICPVYEDSTAI